MSFIESPVFPQTLALGASGGPRFFTGVAQGLGGSEARLSHWAQDRGQWDVGLINRSSAETAELLAFFQAVAKGRANGFRFHDFQPGEGEGTQEFLGTGDATETVFQLVKWYGLEDQEYARTIMKPVSGTVVVTLDDVATTAFWVAHSNGTVHFFNAPEVGVTIRATFEFDVPVRFDTDWLQLRSIEENVWSWEQVTLIETRQVPVPEDESMMLPPLPSVTSGVEILGSVSSLLQLPGDDFNAIMAGAHSLTVACVVSHVAALNPESFLFLFFQSLGVPGASIHLDNHAVQMKLGIGHADYISEQSPFSGQWFCETTGAGSPRVASMSGTPGDPAELGVYVCTFDWGNRAMYVSGSLAAFQSHGTNPTWKECSSPAGPSFAGCTTELIDNGLHDVARGADQCEVSGENFPIMFSSERYQAEIPVNNDVVPGYGMALRLYEMLAIINTIGQAPLTIEQILTQVHQPLLDHFSATYASGLAPGETPPGLSDLVVRHDTALWWRGDTNITVDTPVVLTWADTDGGLVFTNPNANVAFAPESFVLESLPLLTDTLTLAEP